MADGDARRVPAREGRGEVREKGSRFFAFAVRAGTVADAELRTVAANAWRAANCPHEEKERRLRAFSAPGAPATDFGA